MNPSDFQSLLLPAENVSVNSVSIHDTKFGTDERLTSLLKE